MIDRDESASKILAMAEDSNWIWARDIADSRNERRCLNNDPPQLVELERALCLVVIAAGNGEVQHAMVSRPEDGPSQHCLLVLTSTLVIQTFLSSHFDDDPVVTVLARRKIRGLSVKSRYDDNNPRDPDTQPTSTAVTATYEGGGEVLYEEGSEARFPVGLLLGELAADLAGVAGD